MKLANLPYGALFTFKRRHDVSRDPFTGIICRSVGRGRFKPALEHSPPVQAQPFHRKDRVKQVGKTTAS